MLNKTINNLRRGLGFALMGMTLPAWPLDILVTNDDSCTAEGINVLMDALESAGHEVTMYAPAGEQSGRSGAISTAINNVFDISNAGFHGPTSAPNRYCVRIPMGSPAEGAEGQLVTASATPKDSLLAGLARMGNTPPDLVVSGINAGQNIGTTATSSGTVGAAVAALQQGIPAIAVSRNYFSGENGMTIGDLAQLVVDVVANLEASGGEGQPLLPPHTGLNINNPAGPPRGIVHTQVGYRSDILIGPTLRDGDVIVGFNGRLSLSDLVGDAELAESLAANPEATLEEFAAAGLDISDESSMSVAGFITISTIDGDFTAGLRKREFLQLKLRGLGEGGE